MDEADKRPGKFIGTIERYDYGWRASIRTLAPGAVFSQQGESRVFAKEAEALKWLHEEAANAGFVTIDIRKKDDSGF